MAKTAFLFPGQGAQKVGMGKELVAQSQAASALFDQANQILGYDLKTICFEGPADTLNATNYSQPAIFVHSLAALEVLKEQQPDVVENCSATAGLSLGEYTALVFAGVMTFEDALKVVQQRGLAMQAAAEQAESGMVSILGLDVAQVEQLCDDCREEGEVLQLANLLCPGNLVVSGSQSACDRIAEAALEAGAMRTIPLTVAGAFHTSIMQSAVEKLEAALGEATISSPKIDLISNVDADTHTDPEEIRELLAKQVVSPVLWEATIRRLLADGCDHFFEIGPGGVLRGLMKRIARKTPFENVTG